MVAEVQMEDETKGDAVDMKGVAAAPGGMKGETVETDHVADIGMCLARCIA